MNGGNSCASSATAVGVREMDPDHQTETDRARGGGPMVHRPNRDSDPMASRMNDSIESGRLVLAASAGRAPVIDPMAGDRASVHGDGRMINFRRTGRHRRKTRRRFS